MNHHFHVHVITAGRDLIACNRYQNLDDAVHHVRTSLQECSSGLDAIVTACPVDECSLRSEYAHICGGPILR
jgi:hypothetical protein